MIIIINGPCGVGKTTVADRLCTSLDKSVMLDGDYLGYVHPFELYSPTRLDHLYSTLVMNIAHHQRYGYWDFVINYVFESDENLRDLVNRLTPLDPNIFVFRLYADEEAQQERIRRRATDQMDWELERFRELTQIMEPYGDGIGERIDTTHLDPDQVTELILKKVERYQQQELPPLDFAGKFIDWIYQGKKKATTRLVTKDHRQIQEGDWLLATNEGNQIAFGILQVTRIVDYSYADIDDDLAKIENFTDADQLKQELRYFYPKIEDYSKVRVIYFECVHRLDQKLTQFG